MSSRVADDDRRLRRGAGVGHRLLRPSTGAAWTGGGRRSAARRSASRCRGVEAMLEAAVATCRSRPRAASRPPRARRAARAMPSNKRLLDAPLGAGALESCLVAFGEHARAARGPHPGASAAIASTRLRPMTRRLTSGGGTARPCSPNASRQRGDGSSRRCRPASRRNRRSPACSLAGVRLAMAATMSSRPAPVCPSIVAARSSPALCWLNLRVPRTSRRIDLEADDRLDHRLELAGRPSCRASMALPANSALSNRSLSRSSRCDQLVLGQAAAPRPSISTAS